MKITAGWISKLFDICKDLGKMILYLYQLLRGKL